MNLQRLGDRHMGHGTELVDYGTHKAIRKYRSAATERAFSLFLSGLADLGLHNIPGCVEILSETAAYHEQSEIKPLPAQSEEELRVCFAREGTLLFLAYLLGSVDLHAENLIVSGDTPYPIDLETLLTGLPARQTLSGGSLTGSVLRSHLLPNFMGMDDCSGLSGTTAENRNLPSFAGKPTYPWQYLSALTHGFHEAYGFALAHKAEIERLLSVFDGCRFRQLLRPTRTYAAVQSVLELLPKEKREAAAQTMLARAYLNDRDPERAAQTQLLLQSECAAVLRGDIPLYTAPGSSTDLYDGEQLVLKNHLSVSPVALAAEQLRALSPADLAEQEQLIALSYACVTPIESAPELQGTVIEQLEQCAVPGLYSGWTMLDADAHGELFFQSAGYGLYDGLCGILCAYAVLAPEKIEKFYAPYREQVVLAGGKIPLDNRSCGLQSGIGGQLSALLHLSELTGEERYRSDADTLARRLTPEISGKPVAEVMSGVAGLALCLPKLTRETALPLAHALAPILQEAEPTLTGVAHGAAGIALALGAVQTVLQENCYDEKILSMLQWENKYFDEAAGNWQDLRNPEKHGFMSGWCSGAPGIGMARKRLMSYTVCPEILLVCETDIARAKAFLLKKTPCKRDCLCCGTAARLMAASMLGISIGDMGLYERTTHGKAALLHRLDTADRSCGLLQGLAGLGYALGTLGNPLSGGLLV